MSKSYVFFGYCTRISNSLEKSDIFEKIVTLMILHVTGSFQSCSLLHVQKIYISRITSPFFEEMNFISIALSFKSSHNVMYVCMYSLC